MAVTLSVIANSTAPNASPEVSAQVVFPTTGNYTAGGEPCDLTASKMLDPGLIGLIGPNAFLPQIVDPVVMNTAGAYAQFTLGTTLANGLLRLFAANGTEFSGAWGTPWDNVHSYVVLRIYLNPLDR